ncbi:hypothetical protein D3C76_1669500 [compost metagenome]
MFAMATTCSSGCPLHEADSSSESGSELTSDPDKTIAEITFAPVLFFLCTNVVTQ